MKIEARAYSNLAAHGGSLPFVLRAQRLHGLGQLHLDLGRPPNISHADFDLHGEVRLVLHGHALEIGKQGRELIRVREELEDLFRSTGCSKLARKMNGQG